MSVPDKPLPSSTLDVIKESKPGNLSENADVRTKEEQKWIENRGRLQDIDERKKYARRVFWLIVFWLGAVGLIIVGQGFGVTFYCHKFSLATPVLLAIVGGTTASVIGMFVIVIKYLFPTR